MRCAGGHGKIIMAPKPPSPGFSGQARHLNLAITRTEANWFTLTLIGLARGLYLFDVIPSPNIGSKSLLSDAP